MTTLIVLFILFVLLDIIALIWGFDSRDRIDCAEWKRRREWVLSHPMHHD